MYVPFFRHLYKYLNAFQSMIFKNNILYLLSKFPSCSILHWSTLAGNGNWRRIWKTANKLWDEETTMPLCGSRRVPLWKKLRVYPWRCMRHVWLTGSPSHWCCTAISAHKGKAGRIDGTSLVGPSTWNTKTSLYCLPPPRAEFYWPKNIFSIAV